MNDDAKKKILTLEDIMAKLEELEGKVIILQNANKDNLDLDNTADKDNLDLDNTADLGGVCRYGLGLKRKPVNYPGSAYDLTRKRYGIPW